MIIVYCFISSLIRRKNKVGYNTTCTGHTRKEDGKGRCLVCGCKV